MHQHFGRFGYTAWLGCMLVLASSGCGASADAAPQAAEQQQALSSTSSAGSSALAADAQPQAPTLYGGSCSAGTENGGHTAVGWCSGYSDTGTFRVIATCCLTRCSGPVAGNWAYHQGGTSRVGCGSAYATDLRIEQGPAGG